MAHYRKRVGGSSAARRGDAVVTGRLKNAARAVLYPGLDLHTRSRAMLCRFWGTGPRDVLDAGSGNGYFAWLAYRSGARVLAVNADGGQVEKARQFLNGYRGADPDRLRFEQRNLYDLAGLTGAFDEIICYEVLEHLRRDTEVAREFYRLLRPGGALHLCCPYSLHPRHQREILDTGEQGGHVRAGYTEEDYRKLLEPIGYEIDVVAGLGSRALYLADSLLRGVRARAGDVLALPLLPLLLPVVHAARIDPRTPFSLYVRARKPERADEPPAVVTGPV